jgi:hypothetical protein
LDWREQTYPKWTEPLDIYNSQCLGTNVLHYNTLKTLCQISKILKKPCDRYEKYAQNIKEGLNKYLWLQDKKYYGQYLYGRNHMSLSPRSEVLGEALSVLVDVASPSQAQDIVTNTPVLPFGASMIYPNIVDVKTYHNNSNWPFVQAYFNLACAKEKHGSRLSHGIASIYRAAALFGTNKENFTAPTGDPIETEINAVNSDAELWSIAANLTNVYRIFFGIKLHADSISFTPFIPKEYVGQKTLKNFIYRNSRLDITINGVGSTIKEFLVDGKATNVFSLPASLTGNYTLVINMSNELPADKSVNITTNHFTTTTPKPSLSTDKKSLTWPVVKGADSYEIFLNGTNVANTKTNTWPINIETNYKAYQVRAIDVHGFTSFLSEPVTVYSPRDEVKVDLGKASKSNEVSFINLTTMENTTVLIKVTIERDGWYFIDFKYANGNGTIESENKCGIRTLLVENKKFPIIFPQRGMNAWNNWGFTNSAKSHLTKGIYDFKLVFLPENNNMNIDVNEARIDYMRLIYAGVK